MTSNFKLLGEANTASAELLAESKALVARFEEVGAVTEGVTHVLANIATKAREGEPISVMTDNDIAAFMAGVEAMAKALPNAQNVAKIRNSIRLMSAIQVGQDGMISTNVSPLLDVGVRYPDLTQKYRKIIGHYRQTQEQGKPDSSALVQVTRQLQQQIDQAIRVASSTAAPRQNQAAAGPSSPGRPGSGGGM